LQTPMKKTQALIGQAGVSFANAVSGTALRYWPGTSPPETGRTRRTCGPGTEPESESSTWKRGREPLAFPVHLQRQGYQTFYAGKYLNQYGHPAAGGAQHVPLGWSYWNGLVGNSRYYNYTLSANGREEQHRQSYQEDYLTDLIEHPLPDIPLPPSSPEAPSAPHIPTIPTPLPAQSPFPHPTLSPTSLCPLPALRPLLHPTSLQSPPPSSPEPPSEGPVMAVSAPCARRWQTLLSVDDLVEQVMGRLKALDLLASTYVFYTSDNGYHAGELGPALPPGHRSLCHTRRGALPLGCRSPRLPEPILNIDLGPTFLDIAGLNVSETAMDGQSFLPLL
uniref:Sulfatase N-terminal domain-containing protein n=1 Tax=Pelodiscus sinensis TaxID=13735 RepID=K7FHV4_PELSI